MVAERFRLKLTQGRCNGMDPCDHPAAVCCCYHYAGWKHAVFAKVVTAERKAKEIAAASAVERSALLKTSQTKQAAEDASELVCSVM